MSAILLTLVVTLSAIAVVASVVTVARDGYRPTRTDASRFPDRSSSDAIATAIAAAAARPYSSVVPEPGRPESVDRLETAQPEAAHTAVRRAGRARGPRRAVSAPTSPR